MSAAVTASLVGPPRGTGDVRWVAANASEEVRVQLTLRALATRKERRHWQHGSESSVAGCDARLLEQGPLSHGDELPRL